MFSLFVVVRSHKDNTHAAVAAAAVASASDTVDTAVASSVVASPLPRSGASRRAGCTAKAWRSTGHRSSVASAFAAFAPAASVLAVAFASVVPVAFVLVASVSSALAAAA